MRMRALSDAVRHEILRLRSARSTWVLFAVALAAHGFFAAALSRDVRAGAERLDDPETVVSMLTGAAGIGPASVSALLVGLVGVLALGSDYRHRVMHTTLTVLPRRNVLLVAKLAVLAAFGAVTALASAAVAYAVARVQLGAAWTPGLLDEGRTPRALVGFVAFVILTACLGLALAAILRSIPLAAAVLLALPLLVEPGLSWLLDGDRGFGAGDAAAYLPFTAGQEMVALSGAQTGLGAVNGGLAFAGFVAVCAALAASLFTARDV